ncbi:hypothetical protein DPMN_122154 [Dreissena polymorpha]|uniref:Uncharacterized protein n=1 Tax=Dreissena polymorpha TaxID=45954 RepID=A0A9D4GRD3_DREPO|nr:hypothetical protein DPMN_122154 [Dreissena polymorpha]
MGVTGPNTGQLAYLRRHFSPEAVATETPHLHFWHGGHHRAKQGLPSSSLVGPPTQREIGTLQAPIMEVERANTGQFAYLRRHFHRKPVALRRHNLATF